jgi:hypothetical protein
VRQAVRRHEAESQPAPFTPEGPFINENNRGGLTNPASRQT